MKLTFRLFIIFLANLSYAIPVYAKAVEQNDLNFKINTEDLMRGEVHFSFKLLPPKELIDKFPEAFELDSLSVLQESNTKMLMTKSVFIVDKAVGFFDHEHMKNEAYVAHIMGEQKIKKISKDSYEVSVPGVAAHTYKMRSYFDSDDISTLPNSRIIQAATAAKKLDIISQSASSTIIKEVSNFSKYSIAGTSVTSYVPLKENKTLVINYNLIAVKKYYALEKLLKSNFIKEVEALRSLTNSYHQ